MRPSGVFFCIMVVSKAVAQGWCASEGADVDLAPIVIKAPYPSNGSILTAKELERFPGNSWEGALRLVGMDAASRNPTGGTQLDFAARGTNFSGVSVLFQGMRINDPQTAHHNADIPLTRADIGSVSVRGPAEAVRFGPDGVGAALALSVKEPLTPQGLLEWGAGNHDTMSGLVSVTEANESAGVRVSVENRESDGYRPATDSRALTASLTSQAELSSADLKGFFGYNEKEFGAYDFYTPGLGFPSREWTRTYLANASCDIRGDSFTVTPSLLWRRHYDKFALDATTIRSTYLNHHRSDTVLGALRLVRPLGDRSSVGAGIEEGMEALTSTNLGHHERSHAAVFLEGRNAQARSFWEEAALRVDYYDTFGVAYGASLEAGVNLSGDQALFAALTRSVRIPSFTELYYTDPTTIGNDALTDERGLTVEAGYRRCRDNGSYGLTLFSRFQEDAIEWVRRSSSQRWRAENISVSEARGAEGFFNARINACASAKVRYAYTDVNNRDAGLLYKYGYSYTRHAVSVEVLFSLAGYEAGIASTYVKKPARRGWLESNLSLERKLRCGVSVFGRVSNLFNVEYQDIAGVPSPGRQMEGGLRLEW